MGGLLALALLNLGLGQMRTQCVVWGTLGQDLYLGRTSAATLTAQIRVASVVVSIIPRVGTVRDRARLVSRIEVEARAFANADPTTRNLLYGRVLGLLESGEEHARVAEEAKRTAHGQAQAEQERARAISERAKSEALTGPMTQEVLGQRGLIYGGLILAGLVGDLASEGRAPRDVKSSTIQLTRTTVAAAPRTVRTLTVPGSPPIAAVRALSGSTRRTPPLPVAASDPSPSVRPD
jgi:hypothetical protein